jgi:hypothetical protein
MDQIKPPTKPTKNWYEEFGIRYRRPRVKLKHIKKVLKSAWPPEIELHEDLSRKTTELILRFPACSADIPTEAREIYFQQGKTLEKAFQYVLRNTILPTDQRTGRAQLASLGYNSLRATWFHILKSLYLEQHHPDADQKLRKSILSLDATTSLPRGNKKEKERASASAIDDENLRHRYEELLSDARLVHETVAALGIENPDKKANASATEIRAKLWGSIGKQLSGSRTAYLIFTGDVFRMLSKAEQSGAPVRLHVHTDWQPEDLATALLAREEGKGYKTIKKTLKRIARNSVTASE